MESGGIPGSPKRAGVPRKILRFMRRAAFVALAALIVWSTIAFLSFRSAVNERNDQLPKNVRAQLAPAGGPALTTSHVSLLVGADTSAVRRADGEKGGRADSMILMRTDIKSRTVSMLSIPRDLYVPIPGYGEDKINTAYAEGGLPLAIKTIRQFSGIDINHVVQIDFDGFKEVVDALGGIEIDNPTQIRGPRSKKYWFDGGRWFFPKGKQTLDGKHALAYARIRYVDKRTIASDPAESTDIGRARRQQRVIDAIITKIASKNSVLHPRDVPRAVVQPLQTDVSAAQMLAFGFGKWWSKGDNNLKCRLSGDSEYRDGEDVLIGNEDNRAVIRMWLGKQSPVPPSTPTSPGCVRE